jgi:hypothetical protein
MNELGQTRHVAVANIIPYRGVSGDETPNRVWDLPPELQSDIEELESGVTQGNDVAIATSAVISEGWTD